MQCAPQKSSYFSKKKSTDKKKVGIENGTLIGAAAQTPKWLDLLRNVNLFSIEQSPSLFNIYMYYLLIPALSSLRPFLYYLNFDFFLL